MVKEEKLKTTETSLMEMMHLSIHSNGNRIHSFPIKLVFSIDTDQKYILVYILYKSAVH